MNSLNCDHWIRDPVHGHVRLTELERRVIDTPTFQRLRRVKQLGLACAAFPSADYPRFEHSPGVLEIAGRVIDRLQQRGLGFSKEQVQQYRLAALLHDVGHFPFSHTMEHALRRWHGQHGKSVARRKADPKPAAGEEPDTGIDGMMHEAIGRLLLTQDPDLSRLLPAEDAQEIANLFTRQSASLPLVNLISSDLDADRLDYLARDACHTGLPYGKTDIEYLLERIELDDEKRLCFDEKALRSVEHMLVARFVDYQTLVRQRTVVGLELLLTETLAEMLERKALYRSVDALTEVIRRREWHTYDDLWLMNELRRFESGLRDDPFLKDMLFCILHRVPPKVVGELEWFEPATPTKKSKKVQQARAVIEERRTELAKAFGVPPSNLLLWDSKTEFTKCATAHLPVDQSVDNAPEIDPDALLQGIRIKMRDGNGSRSVFDLEWSYLRTLSRQRLHTLRLYVVPTRDAPIDKARRRQLTLMLKEQLKDQLHEFTWK